VIVVAGSRHDPVAAELVRRWPAAALCDADDLMAPGWRWQARASPGPDARRWVVGGEVVPDAEVTGVFLRRAAVHADELAGTHPDDRAYLAAEALAFLVFVLATTGAVVVNPVSEGTLGVDALRPERWMHVAAELGVAVAPLRLSTKAPSAGSRPGPGARPESLVEVVAGEASPAGTFADAAAAVADSLGLRWAVAGFDGAGRLSTLTTTPAPSPEAAARLGVLLAGPAGRAT
jgi:hypothetical protein